MAARDPFRIDHIPNEHLIGIGKVAAHWAFLEGTIERIIRRLLRLNDRQGIAITTHMNIGMRIDAMSAAIKEEFPNSDLAIDLPKIGKRIRKHIAPKRNSIVHNRIVKFPDAPEALRIIYKARGQIVKEHEIINLSEYGAICSEMGDTTQKLLEALSEIIDLVKAKDGVPSP